MAPPLETSTSSHSHNQNEHSHVVNSHLLQPARAGREGRSYSAASSAATVTPGAFPPRLQSLAASSAMFAGSFASDIRILRPDLRPEMSTMSSYGAEEDARAQSEKRQAELRDEIQKEAKIKEGSEKMLEALTSKSARGIKEQKRRVEDALNMANRKLLELQRGLEEEIQRSKDIGAPEPGSMPPLGMRGMSAGRAISRQGGGFEEHQSIMDFEEEEEEAESPTFILAEILEGIDAESLQPEYYVDYMNRLVELFKRHPSLKYDLEWQAFGLRMQTMLLSESREVVAAGYRVLRYSITDLKSLQTIRALHTDYLVILSLVRDSKIGIEREQALKFVRSFLDVKGGVAELSRAVLRIVVAVAAHHDDRLRNIAVLTLAEILVQDPKKVVDAGGMGVLSEALASGSYRAAEGLIGAFLFLLDTPGRRKFLRSGHELDVPLSTFGASPLAESHDEKAHEAQLRASAKVIGTLLRSWPGLIALSTNRFAALRSLVASLQIPLISVRTVLLEFFTDILRIKPPSWGSSFLAGRRLTTYARVTNLKANASVDGADGEDDGNQWSLVDHFLAALLGALLHAGLLESLLEAEEDPLTLQLKRKTSLLIGEVLKMANEFLPVSWASQLQVLPNLLASGIQFGQDERFISVGTLYQLDSVNRTLYRSELSLSHPSRTFSVADALSARKAEQQQLLHQHKVAPQAVQVDEAGFRTMMIDSGVLNSASYTKWRWDIIQTIVDGPLRNPKRLDEALKSTKFLHRLLGFYRPFKWRFSSAKNTKPNQRYVRTGCALMTTLMQNPEGIKYLEESKFIRQLGEALAQLHLDVASANAFPMNPESPNAVFSPSQLAETLSGGYFALLGALSKQKEGFLIFERWRLFNIFYHIVELSDREDLVKLLLGGMDFTLDSHLRLLLSKAVTSCTKEIRIFGTRLLRRYAVLVPLMDHDDSHATAAASSSTNAGGPVGSTNTSGSGSDNVRRASEWAIRLLVTQLYDPQIEVCEVAVKILEEACSRSTHSLEYIVKCRPALDHLGEIGAPLLLRFLSTSVGYKYLDELDYITREMDDWFLGRNDSYVALVEASLARALMEPQKEKHHNHHGHLNHYPHQHHGHMGGAQTDDPNQVVDLSDPGVVPPHFYRELTRTQEGCNLLAETGHFDQFANTIADYAMEHEDAETILKVKGCLWAVANVGSMELGAPFLEESDVVERIVAIAERSEVLSLRGTAFFALGLISRSLHGQEILLELGWDSTVNMRGESLGYCLPLNFGRLFSVEGWGEGKLNNKDAVVIRGLGVDESAKKSKSDDPNPTTARVLKCVAMLGNTVMSKRAAGELLAIKNKKPRLFQSPELFRKVMAVLESHYFHHAMWNFAMNLFDRTVMRNIVLEEDMELEEIGDEEQAEPGGAEEPGSSLDWLQLNEIS